MIQLNLLPDVKKEFIKSQRTKSTVIGVATLVTLGSVALAVLLGGIVYLVQPGLIALTQNSIDGRSEELRNVPDINKYLTIQNQLESLPGLHEQTVEYSRMFAFLKILNPAAPNSIRLSSLQVDTETKLATMTGVTGGFKAFSVFEDTLDNAKVSYKDQNGEKQTAELFTKGSIVVREQALASREGQEELTFTIEAAYNPEVFIPGIKDIKLTVPNIQTTQSITGRPSDATSPVFEENQ